LELALVTPILVVLLLAIFQFGFVLQTQMGLTNAVREAARRIAATEPNAGSDWTDGGAMERWVQAQLCGDSTPPCDGGLLVENVQAFDGARLDVDPPEVAFCHYAVTVADGSSVTQYRVLVDLTYAHPVFFGPMAYATDLVDSNAGNGAWDLSVSAQMRLENLDAAVTGAPAGACPP
jgi:hypothetical protein